MRQALRQPLKGNPARAQVSIGDSIPAPVGGWNAQDSLAKMPRGDAVQLSNFIPRAGYVEVRRGSQEWATGFSSPVETLISYRTSSPKLFAVSGTSVYDISTAAAIGSAAYSGLTSARVQWVNFSNAAGIFIVAVNGADTPFKYNGSAFSTTSITASGLTSSDLIDITVHKRRLFFVEKDTLHVWYLDIEAISGTALLLDLGPIFSQGGTIACIGSWSLDGGQGQDDYLVVMTTEGQIAIWQGNDPSDANYWALVGVFSVGRPLGRRALFKFGGDLQILTTNGVLPMSQALNKDRAQDNDVAVTAKIRNAWASATLNYSMNFGWQALTYERGQLAIYNIPTEEDVSATQYVQNLQTGSWCNFSGLNAMCWGVSNGDVYYGTPTTVMRWDQGVADGNAAVVPSLLTSFDRFRSSRLKQFEMIRPILNVSSNVLTVAVAMQADFVSTPLAGIPITTIDGGGAPAISAEWTSVQGVGYYGAVQLAANLQLDPSLVSNLVDGAGNQIVDAASGNHIVTASDAPINNSILQVIGFDILYQDGGQL
jgi:hypothetical protein